MTQFLATRVVLAAITLGAGVQLAGAAPVCSTQSPTTIAPVVELYTSEGCSSCPPADRWLSRLKSDPAVVALAFHVDYWDRLGWKDRFSSAASTQRQAQQHLSSGAGFSYTPQVIVDGVDRKDWPRLAAPMPTAGPASVNVVVARDNDSLFSASVAALAHSPARLAAYWAVTEQDFVSNVKSGENGGATLHHDDVVREYQTVPAWSPRNDAATFRFEAKTPVDPAHPRHIVLVVVDADTGRPVQAVKLGC